jgi:hypothetical protein
MDDIHESEIREAYGNQIYASVKALTSITRTIEMLAGTNLLLLVCSIAIVATSLFAMSGFPIYLGSADIAFFSSTILIVNLLALFAYDRWRRKGNTLFTELSEELQWDLHDEPLGRALHREGPGRPQLPVRVVLRSFIKNTDLPLTSGPSGVQLYLAINLVFWLATMFTVIFSRTMHH